MTRIGIYHKNCTDGTTAGAVLLMKFPDIKLFPLVHSHTEEDLAHIHKATGEGGEIYFVDFTAGIEEFLDGRHSITAIDHHIGVKKYMEKLARENKNLTYIFDNDKSGASLTWSYFFPNKEMPEIIKYVEDSDLWTHKYGNETKYVNGYLSMFLNSPEKILDFMKNDIDEIKKKGEIITEYSDNCINKLVESVQDIKLRIGEFTVHAYNITMYESAIGHELSKLHNQAVAIFTINGGNVKFSFRSNDGNSPTAFELAQILGGSGHKNASGANISLKDFLKMIIW